VFASISLRRPVPDLGVIGIRIAIVSLTLTTAMIHAQLGGLLFLVNAIGYTVLAACMVLPGPAARIRWLVRLALIGFTAATIVGWLLVGARFQLAYMDKAIEIILILAVVSDLWLTDGGPIQVGRRLVRVATSSVHTLAGRT
jgi:hypothetical protein